MVWGKMDDKFHRNRKVRALRLKKGGREALGVWTFWWSWCLDDPELTGVVPSSELAAGEEKAADLLVEAGLWERTADGYRYHDFHDYNPTRGQVDKKREADRTRVASKRGASREDVARDSDATRERIASTRVSRPVPSQPNPEGDPTPQGCVISSGGRAPVRVCEVGPSAEETQRRFRALFLERFNAEPYMGGKAVHTLHARLVGTATARGMDPLVLLAETFARWAAEPLDQIGKSAPYAAFAGRFGSLLEAQSGHALGEQEQLREDQASALRAGDRERYRSLVAEEYRRFPNGGSNGSRG